MTAVAAIGQRRALAYTPLAALMGLSCALIDRPGLEVLPIALALGFAALVTCLHLALRRFGSSTMASISSWSLGIQVGGVAVLGFVCVLGVATALLGHPTIMSAMAGLVTALALMAYWLSAQPERAQAPAQASLFMYLGSMVLPVAALFGTLPVACVWASLASVPAWHARRLMSEEGLEPTSLRLLSASIFIFVWILCMGLVATALLGLRGRIGPP
ncbi:MAG: hypothetical protein EBS90_05165 [Betaproteobacteria bacterium]|nr:hypothetical protein [Betaproteobacteria bacterium]